MANPFASAHLIYRAIETPDDDEMFQQIAQNPFGFQNSNAGLVRPQARADAMRHQKFMMEQTLLGVTICLPPTSSQTKPTAVGTIHVDEMSKLPHHRSGMIGLNILPEYQGQGYGSEAIKWSLDWAFKAGNLHRVEIRAFEWNVGARRLYERIGFVHEGTSRERWWHDGRYWGDYAFSILDREWKEIREKETAATGQ